MATLAILSALAEEQQGLLACLSQPVCLRRAGREVWRGQWQGHEVLLALSRIGKVAAATTATALIEGLEKEQREVRSALADSTLFAKDPAQATALFARDAQIDTELVNALERWEILSVT